MKAIIYILCAGMVVLSSCGRGKEAQRLLNSKDSLEQVLAARDSMIDGVFESLNKVTENLSAIKQRENLLNAVVSDGEIKKEAAAQINEDIEAINQLLIENRATIAELEKSAAGLKRANIRIASLEKMIREMSAQAEVKDAEIKTLRENLANLHVQVDQLTTTVSGLEGTVASLNVEKTQLEGEVKTRGDMLNVAYYIVGSQRELVNKEIVYKSGFIGKTLKINENRSLDSFTQIDIRSFDEVLIGKPNAVLISSHPSGSYEFVMSDKRIYSSLVIKDREKFWEFSKVLVIGYK